MNRTLKHELPNLMVIILGLIVSFLGSWISGLIYAILVIFSIFWMAKFICTHCIGFGNDKCPSVYGKIAGKLFKKSEKPNFEKNYKRNLPVVMLEWIYPVISGIYYLIVLFDIWLLIFVIIFIMIAFVWLPKKSAKDCSECDNEECPHKKSLKKNYKIGAV